MIILHVLANQVAVDLVTKKVKTTKLPDQNGDGKNVKYSLTKWVIDIFRRITYDKWYAKKYFLNISLTMDLLSHYQVF